MKAHGFILQASYRVSVAHRRRVPVVHLYGRLDDGKTFLVRDDRQHPHFYIRAQDVARVLPLGVPEPQPTTKRSFDGASVCCIEVSTPHDVPDIRNRLHAAGIDTFEADVRFAMRYLIERGIKGGCEIDGEAIRGDNVDLVFDNPELRPAHVHIAPRVLAFDIETDAKAQRLLAIREPDVVIFADAGKSWITGDGPGRIPNDRIPVLREWASDIGFGFDAGGIGLYISQPLTGGRPLTLTARLQRRF